MTLIRVRGRHFLELTYNVEIIVDDATNWFAQYWAAYGLILNMIGVAIIAIAQSRLTVVIDLWLNSLDFFVETYLNKAGPVVRFEGVDEQMRKAVTLNRRIAIVGWGMIGFGFLLQIPGALP